MIRAGILEDRTVTTTPAHVEIIADRYGVGVTELDGYYFAVIVKPGQEQATVWCAPVPDDERINGTALTLYAADEAEVRA